MVWDRLITAATYGVLAIAVISVSLAPAELPGVGPRATAGETAIRTVRWAGIIRDFTSDHPDFQPRVTGEDGLCVGLVATRLGEDGRPLHRGAGVRVLEPARDGQDRHIAPHLARGGGLVATDDLRILLVVSSVEEPGDADVAWRELLASWGNEVTLIDEEASTADFESAFGHHDAMYVVSYASAAALRGKLASAPIGVVAAHAAVCAEELSFSYGTRGQTGTELVPADNTHEISAGFDGETTTIATAPIPLHRAYGGLAPGAHGLMRVPGSAKPAVMIMDTGGMRHDGEATRARRVRLPWGAVTTEVGSTPDSPRGQEPSADAPPQLDPQVLTPAAHTMLRRALVWAAGGRGQDAQDRKARQEWEPRTAGISSAESFDQWFRNDPEVNRSTPLALRLVRQENGSCVFDDTLDPQYRALGGFHPIDGRLLGNEAPAANNHYFTYRCAPKFVYRQGRGQHVTITTNAEVWAFIDDTLVIDLGGHHDPVGQFVDLDRLGLADGETYVLSLFLAQRWASRVRLRIDTNITF